jgi:hypothetical protein
LFTDEKTNTLCCWPLNGRDGITFRNGNVYKGNHLVGCGMMREEMREYAVIQMADGSGRKRVPVELLRITQRSKAYAKRDAAVQLPSLAKMVLATGMFEKINP